MPKYRATLRVSGITGESPRAVRSTLDEQLRKSGLEHCRVVSVDLDDPPQKTSVRRPPAAAPSEPAWRRQANIGGLLLVATAAWALWFFWWMLAGASE